MNVALPGWRLAVTHWPLLAVCALFLVVAAFVVDDYGISGDGEAQRATGLVALDYLAGEGERAFERLWFDHDRYYGPGWELLLVLVERVLRLEDSRDIWISRHFLTHLFFLVSGAFCYLLVYRIRGSRMLALVAMVLFLLHPRLYAQSFINSKDLPFLAMFMIALYVTHTAFRRDTLGSFLLCGVSVGILVHLRIMGVILFAAVLAMRALDLALARDRQCRARTTLTMGAFALGALLTCYALMPSLWTDPVGRFGELWNVLSNHPNPAYNLFRGESLYAPDGPPFDYIPVWIGITTPLVVPWLALVGAAGLIWQGTRRPGGIPRNTSLRFSLLLLFLFVAPIIYVPAAGNNLYHDWRQVSFLYAPLVLLAAVGLGGLFSFCGEWRMRAGVWVLMGVGVAVIIVSMVKIHPLHPSYFNTLVDRTTPNRLISQYPLGGWQQDYWMLLRDIVDDHPEQRIFVTEPSLLGQAVLLPASERKWISSNVDAVYSGAFYSDQPVSGQTYTSRIYNNNIASFKGMQVKPGEAAEIIQEALAGEPVRTVDPSTHGSFWLHDNAIVFVMKDCSMEYLHGYAMLHLYPMNPTALYGRSVRLGFVQEVIRITHRQKLDDGRCAVVFLLPDYPVVRANAFQWRSDERPSLWNAWFGFTPPIDEAVLARDPAASSVFDVYLDDNALVYVKNDCTDVESDTYFFLHLFPEASEDLPFYRQQHGFDNLDFRFWQYGGKSGDRCIARVPLPAYPIASVRTGQDDATGEIWTAQFPLVHPDAVLASLSGEPVASSVYDIYREGRTLTYVREGCTEDDTVALFFLHVEPVDVADLPAPRREHGFANLDFSFAARGARTDGKCVAVVPLPAYPIASVRTGQYDETGQLWSVEFSLPDRE